MLGTNGANSYSGADKYQLVGSQESLLIPCSYRFHSYTTKHVENILQAFVEEDWESDENGRIRVVDSILCDTWQSLNTAAG